jgi:hypothetical protein
LLTPGQSRTSPEIANGATRRPTAARTCCDLEPLPFQSAATT